MSEAIERRDQGDALSQVLGTGDTKAMLAQVEQNVKAVIDVARARGFVRRYGDNDQEFYGEPAWSLLGLTYGLVGFVEWTRKIDNGWEARAVARTREGVDVAAAEAMCTRTEGNRRNAPDHTLRAMAQTRARRNALRSALGAALVLAGFDFPDPEAPATTQQVGLLHKLGRDLYGDSDKAKADVEISHFRDLTREQASELIEGWAARLEDQSSPARHPHSTPGGNPAGPGGDPGGTQAEVSSGPQPDEPPPASLWAAANQAGLTSGKALLKANELVGVHPLFSERLTSAHALTTRQLEHLIASNA